MDVDNICASFGLRRTDVSPTAKSRTHNLCQQVYKHTSKLTTIIFVNKATLMQSEYIYESAAKCSIQHILVYLLIYIYYRGYPIGDTYIYRER